MRGAEDGADGDVEDRGSPRLAREKNEQKRRDGRAGRGISGGEEGRTSTTPTGAFLLVVPPLPPSNERASLCFRRAPVPHARPPLPSPEPPPRPQARLGEWLAARGHTPESFYGVCARCCQRRGGAGGGAKEAEGGDEGGGGDDDDDDGEGDDEAAGLIVTFAELMLMALDFQPFADIMRSREKRRCAVAARPALSIA